jgi:hypothetical protein
MIDSTECDHTYLCVWCGITAPSVATAPLLSANDDNGAANDDDADADDDDDNKDDMRLGLPFLSPSEPPVVQGVKLHLIVRFACAECKEHKYIRHKSTCTTDHHHCRPIPVSAAQAGTSTACPACPSPRPRQRRRPPRLTKRVCDVALRAPPFEPRSRERCACGLLNASKEMCVTKRILVGNGNVMTQFGVASDRCKAPATIVIARVYQCSIKKKKKKRKKRCVKMTFLLATIQRHPPSSLRASIRVAYKQRNKKRCVRI